MLKSNRKVHMDLIREQQFDAIITADLKLWLTSCSHTHLSLLALLPSLLNIFICLDPFHFSFCPFPLFSILCFNCLFISSFYFCYFFSHIATLLTVCLGVRSQKRNIPELYKTVTTLTSCLLKGKMNPLFIFSCNHRCLLGFICVLRPCQSLHAAVS